jgi:hypothetical protein
MTYVKRAQRFAWGRRYLTVALLALVVGTIFAVTSALGSGTKGASPQAANSLFGGTPNTLGTNSSQATNCGYPDSTAVSGSSGSLAQFGVKENSTLPAFRPALATPANPATLTSGSTMQAFYSDEHNMTLGTKAGGTGTFVAPPEMVGAGTTAGSTNTFAAAHLPGTGYTVAGGADQSPTSSNGGVDNRPLSPELYITDITADPAALADPGHTANYIPEGDWQNSTNNGRPGALAGRQYDGATPDDVFGQWKNATMTGEDPGTVESKVAGGDSPSTLSQAKWNANLPGGNPATTGGVPNLGQDPYPSNLSTYLAEVRWTATAVGTSGQFTLGGANGSQTYTLKPGRTYRLQFELDDGDHGLDSGEACTYVKVPPANPAPTTTAGVTNGATGTDGLPHVKLAGDSSNGNHLDAGIHDSLVLTGGTADAGAGRTDASCASTTPTPTGCLIFRAYLKGGSTTDAEALCRGGSTPGSPANNAFATPALNSAGVPIVIYKAANNGANNTGAADPNGKYSTGDVLVDQIGHYHWTVQYTGNTENTTFAGRTPAIGLSSGETFCNISGEELVVDPTDVLVSTTNKPKVVDSGTLTLKASGGGSANAVGAIKAGDAVTVKLFAGTCTDANHNSGGTQQGNTITITLEARGTRTGDPPSGSGWINADGSVSIGSMTYPDDFGTSAPALTNGAYWWNVVYTPASSNTQVTQQSVDDACTETFTLSGL